MPTTYTLTGDVIADRQAWKAAGCPADHPYLTDPEGVYAPKAGPVVPLALTLTAEQTAYMEAVTPALRAQSDANVAALLR